ncbi:MAG: glycine cleavage system protein H [Candidatus Omnitrophica bacterium CG11_big_fil_rev_8_21_14_0_20_45_26]|uniref:Glycine cleavage system H protein n=1 Tax=Candidatus Abzuiibacterium crystallinum TaxID=1974748 RepID=A0A2H0LPL6_9BACT|nr:MAG: glycine cleavage system protein H [Candidatus Omnitrophica bacterium CG11_big_fil_rev_8_21_14_0_20_45_26]PIW64316.1 MAG: glycine cleavage system protein H [Candidatus Omnitrophica bacterium CG12_big_fil_rev_8_21_14_0_65_45_16]
MNIPKDLRYTKTHEWIKPNQETVTVGITDYAQHEISDIVFVELPKVGQEAAQGKAICVVESVKAAFDIYAPVSGVVKSINTTLESDPAMANKDPYGNGWFFELTPADSEEINNCLSHSEYEDFLKQSTH